MLHKQEQEVYSKEVISLLYTMFGYSSRRNVHILVMYLEGCSMSYIGKEFSISTGRVNQIIKRYIRKLKHPTRYKTLQ